MMIQTIVTTELVFYRRQYATCLSLYPSAFRFPYSIRRGPSPFHEKHPNILMPLPPNFTVGTKTHAGRYRSPGICHTHRTSTWYREIHHSKSDVISCPLSSGVTLYTTFSGASRSQAKYLVYGQLLLHGTPFLLPLNIQSW
jgi:hypothetical protein